NREEVNIMTVEDPVEYQFPRIRQVQVNVKAGLTFASALRSFLRQDPDVIMVGEIRDLETAEIAVQAALTGHLVLSTLHTNDSPSAFTRLIDMGVEPFLVSSSLLGVLAQRLVRKVCSKCKEEYTPSSALIKDLGLEGKVSESIKFVKGRGCKLCNSSGYKGRIGIFELLKVTPKIQELVLSRASADDIGKVAHQEGMRSLREAAIDKLLEGVITPEEVMRVTQSLKK
ncbi:MAG: type II secretion system protein GspE, partial [Candidatus Omnitrophota bacterium]